MANDFLSRDNEWAWEVEFICSNGKTLKRKQRTIWNDKKLLFPHVFCSKVLNEICFCKVFVRKPLKTLTWSSSTTETAKAFDHSWLLLTREWANDRLERSNNISFNVTKFGEISYLGNFLDGLFSIWQTSVRTLAFLCSRANCHCCKWPKFE